MRFGGKQKQKLKKKIPSKKFMWATFQHSKTKKKNTIFQIGNESRCGKNAQTKLTNESVK